jgi:ABC-type dipeptide/oligopeptide/nickel transport system permease subunit
MVFGAASSLVESSLAFLGLADPHHKSWGVMAQYGLNSSPWETIGCGGGSLRPWPWELILISLPLIGFGLESRFEPTLRR